LIYFYKNWTKFKLKTNIGIKLSHFDTWHGWNDMCQK